jgi:hypothetical protein
MISTPSFLASARTLAAIIATSSGIHAAMIGSDSANDAAYDAPGFWQNGDNGGTPLSFGVWLLTSQGAQSGHFIGDSTSLAGGNSGANINTTGESFGLFAHTGQTANAFRDFGGLTLSVGQTFSLDLAVNFRNGDKGFVLRDSTDADIFTFKITGDDYLVTTAATGVGSIGSTYSADTEFNVSLTQTSATGGTWTITRSGGVSDVDTGTYNGVAENFILYNSQTTGSGAAEDNLYVNNLQIVPEPTTGAMMLTALAGLGFIRRRRA